MPLLQMVYTRLHLRGRADHELGADDAVELLGGELARLKRRLAEGDAGLVGVLGDGGNVVVADGAVGVLASSIEHLGSAGSLAC